MADDVSAHLLGGRPGSLAPPLDERGELWARWDRACRLAGGLERRAAEVITLSALGSQGPAPHPRLTASGDLIDELVAIDAAVVADVVALQAARARLRANVRAQAGAAERARVLLRSAAALLAVALSVVVVSVVR